jgi:ubiquinone/menaquinone biosynthesis C-methylase UbiE
MRTWGTLDDWLREIHRALKPNGVLGVIGESDRMTLKSVRVEAR